MSGIKGLAIHSLLLRIFSFLRQTTTACFSADLRIHSSMITLYFFLYVLSQPAENLFNGRSRQSPVCEGMFLI